MTKAKCPHCVALIERFEQVGEETGWRCPECKGDIDIDTVEKVEETENPAEPAPTE